MIYLRNAQIACSRRRHRCDFAPRRVMFAYRKLNELKYEPTRKLASTEREGGDQGRHIHVLPVKAENKSSSFPI
jgi:hypothetical protein